MEARVHDAVHIKIEVVELDAVRVRPARVDWNLDAIDDNGSFFADLHHREGVPIDQPPVESGNSHPDRCRFPEFSRGARVLV